MELRSCIAFIGDHATLEKIDSLINEESLIDDMVFSVDFISELETNDTYVYRCYSDSDSWINIYEIQNRFTEILGKSKYDIIYASTDSKTFVDVVSISGNFDAYIDTDTDKIQEVCDTYGLEFFGSDEEDDYQIDDYYNDDDDYY
ncbi:hypothetical protein SEPL_119 [Salmonella phage SE_PL]|uniref:hypothetical protein n=1 Tax=Salmonella enterica TaxID=28901 RepID=UPI000FDF9373|nr:hypothetical protein CPT_Munch_308 [Salmonella phage Munch]EAZ2022603.1 hypothetical protein [Salmonella enterica]ECV9083737.1 hypothetical protein [Salmonella enterica subsp. enterica serovar Infantis]MCP0435672.1 hypothetical protein [Salmonella enterica subsp. enterica serovar Mbandaka]QCW19005.1 hypothetical protein 7t3_0485 [Salmonella phage 7t3]QIG62732.1 hypothetical protein SEPL_119 [Salmonella phage SE_PL]